MHAIRTTLRALLIPLGGLVAATAGADQPASPWTFGTQLGQVSGGASHVAAAPETADPSTMSYDVAATWGDDKRLGWRVFTGYQFTDYLAVHVGYTDLGKMRTRFADNGMDRFLESDRLVTQSVRGVDVGLQLKLPLSERVSVAFRGGKYFWKSRTRVSDGWELSPEGSIRRDSNNFFGAGLDVGVLDDLTATLGWTRYQVAGDPIALWTVGVLYGFDYF